MMERIRMCHKCGASAPTWSELLIACTCAKGVDHADELGRVWDVLHAAGINGAGGISASEGVKLLAEKLLQNKEVMNAAYGKAIVCTKCGATRSAV